MQTAKPIPLKAPANLLTQAPDWASAYTAANALPDRSPDLSARDTLTSFQAMQAKRFVSCVGAACLLWPDASLFVLGGVSLVFFMTALVFRLVLAVKGATARPAVSSSGQDVFPVYSIMIGLKDEAAVASQLSDSLARLDYPVDRLDVKLLLEEGDCATLDAVKHLDWPSGTEVLVLPPGAPQTKPRALNYGLQRARGEFVVIYDAEDRPHPGQLKEAVAAFVAGPPDLACVQAPLVGTPAKDNWIAGHWALEYAVQFGAVLPAMAALDIPIMLGGTSNHFRRQALVEAGGWDAWNVTEDADLGLRLARLGKRVGVICSPTLETPPARLDVWVSQRSRWLKGFMQTWLVIMRQPAAFIRAVGVKRFVAVQLSLGAAILSGLVHGVWAIGCLLALILPGQQLSWLVWASLGVAYLGGAVTANTGGRAARWCLLLTLPLYWPLQTIAAWRALYGLLKRPHFWAKTPHIA